MCLHLKGKKLQGFESTALCLPFPSLSCLDWVLLHQSQQQVWAEAWNSGMAERNGICGTSSHLFSWSFSKCPWYYISDGLIEGKTRAHKWILAGARQSSCHWADSAPNPVTKHGHYTNPLWLAVIFIQLTHGMLLKDSAKEWMHLHMTPAQIRCQVAYDQS